MHVSSTRTVKKSRTLEAVSPDKGDNDDISDDQISSDDSMKAINLIKDFYMGDRETYRTKVDEVTLFGPSKAEDNARR